MRLVLVALGLGLGLGLGQPAAPMVVGIDHVPVAVGDLDRAGERYRALGFALKQGRPHDDGIRNLHVKFTDGTEIELITAAAATDDPTRTYLEHLKAGDGPAFLALFAAPDVAVERRLEDAGVTVPAYVFFGHGEQSPTDRPEHFAHTNTAERVTRVWLAGDDFGRERRMLAALGAKFSRQTLDFPGSVQAEVAEFARGSVVLLPGRHQIVRGRPIVGITVAVRDLDAAQQHAGPEARRTGTSVFVDPLHALGYWLEFRSAPDLPALRRHERHVRTEQDAHEGADRLGARNLAGGSRP